MHRATALLILCASLPLAAGDFSGERALGFTRRLVAFGPRPAGSQALEQARLFIHAQLHSCRCAVSEDAFTAATPAGPKVMKNIIARFAGSSGQAVVISGHYDTKLFPGRQFTGANDGGSSAGLLLELARAVAGRPHHDDIYLVWFDGEEAVAEWSDADGLYGSRHLAARWTADGTAARIKALVNVDMTGDRELGILQEMNSAPALRALVWKIAGELGYAKYFLNSGFAVDDDHLPFVKRGVNALDLIDFNYGPGNAWWHTDQDTMDKLDARSFEVVGRVLLELIRRI